MAKKKRLGGSLQDQLKSAGLVTDKQIKELGIEVTPLHPETELRRAGVQFEAQTAFRDFFATHTVVDEEKRFVTGQNQNSGHTTAQAMLSVLATRR